MKSVDKFDHPDFVGGVVWSSCELEWIRNRDKEWESELAEVRRENAELKEALQHPSYEVENRLRAQRDELLADAERLDWISRALFQKWWNGVVDNGSRTYWRIVGDYRHTVSKMEGVEFRAAIDAAIAAARKEKVDG